MVIARVLLWAGLSAVAASCGGPSTPTTAPSVPSHDMARLGKLCVLPEFVERAEWQDYSVGNDWGIVARLRISDAGARMLDGSLRLSGESEVFVGLVDMPTWIGKDSGFVTTTVTGRFGSQLPVFQPGPFTRSPLLHGFVVRPDARTLILGLHTQ